MPRCYHLNPASPLIARPTTPRAARPFRPSWANCSACRGNSRNTTDAGPAFTLPVYQTVEPCRGLEALIDVLGRLRTACDLHLRGLHARNFSAKVTARARTAGFRGEINFLLLVQSATILTLSSAHTLGPSLEKSTPRNRELCLTNKIFTCLLSGTPVLLTPTRAQQRLATDLGETALVLNFDRPADTAEKLDAWLASPSRRHAAARARALGLGRYNWDYEQASFLQTLRSTLAKSAS